MNKKILGVMMALMMTSQLFAGTFDLGITLGTEIHLFEEDFDQSKMKMAWGLSMGLNENWELDLQSASQLIPDFFGDTTLSVLLQRTLLGQRSTGNQIAGLGVNSLVGGGIMFSSYNNEEVYKPTHLLFSLTPITIGTPISGKRERLVTLTLAYNLHTQQVSMLFDVIKYDFYVVGSYQDYL
ncbi:MAG: hypothetical protein WC136_06365 [Sphaerochaeta sp.]|nr:hypothetical protein [Sphaerochaeta sp.]